MKYLKLFNESFIKTYTELSNLSGSNELSDKELRNHKYIVMSDNVKNLLQRDIKYDSYIQTESHGENNYSYLKVIPNDRDIDVLDEYFDFVNVNCIINIVEMEDEWFRVDFKISFKKNYNYKTNHTMRIFVCDQLDGLMELLKNQRLLK